MRNNNITVIGAGFAGLVNALGHADLGDNVSYFDVDGIVDRSRNIQRERLSFPTSYAEAIRGAEFVIIAGVPAKDMLTVVESIADVMDHPLIIVNKSTVPVGTGDWVAEIIRRRHPRAPKFAVVHCSEFMRKGHFVDDFMSQRKVFVRSKSADAASKVAETLYVDSANVVVRVV